MMNEPVYGVEASPSLISAITDAVMEEVTASRNRPLEPCYPIVFVDAIRVNIPSDGAVSNKAVFVAVAVLAEGTRDVLGLWSKPMLGFVICGRLRFCKGFLERLGSKQVAVICPACVRGGCDRWP